MRTQGSTLPAQRCSERGDFRRSCWRPSGDAATCEHQGPRSGKISLLAVAALKAASAENRCNLAVQMTSAGESFPQRCDSMLPGSHPQVRVAAVLDEDKSAICFHYPPNFIKREPRIVNGAQRPVQHD